MTLRDRMRYVMSGMLGDMSGRYRELVAKSQSHDLNDLEQNELAELRRKYRNRM